LKENEEDEKRDGESGYFIQDPGFQENIPDPQQRVSIFDP
jgi:hypothetical protein